MGQQEYWYWILNIQKVDRKKINRALRKGVTPEAIFTGSQDFLKELGFGTGEVRQLKEENIWLESKKKYEKMLRQGIRLVNAGEEGYPRRLSRVLRPPLALYVKGNLPEHGKKRLAVIGARECSSYGRELAFYFGKKLAESGIEIVSGLARGIDAAAHTGAVRASGKTYAVLGCGVDICYPRENWDLYGKILETGGILSEYPPGISPLSFHFPMRNRIISGLVDGILVIEAREKSGSLITVEDGLENGRDIFAIPGRVTDTLSTGCNRLIKAGAVPVTEPEDILDYYGFFGKSDDMKKMKKKNVLDLDEQMVYSKLCLEPKHMDEIALECGISLLRVMNILLSLETKAMVKQPIKNYYIRCLT